MKKQNIINLFIGIVSILALVFSLIRVTPFDVSADTYTGVIVTLLSIVVTIVIGYQIFNIIEFKEELHSQATENQRLHQEIVDMKNEVKELQADLQKKISISLDLSLIKNYENEAKLYYNTDPEAKCTQCISCLLSAIKIGLDSDYKSMNGLLCDLRRCMTKLSGSSLGLSGSHQKEDGRWYLGQGANEMTVEVWINEYLLSFINLLDQQIRKHPEYNSIRYEYARIKTIFDERVRRIIENPSIVFDADENDAILKDSPLFFDDNKN